VSATVTESVVEQAALAVLRVPRMPKAQEACE